MNRRLEGTVAIITGGGQGIGRGIALMFARQGARVAIASRTEQKLERVRRELEELGAEVLAVPTDVGQEEQVKALIDATAENFGGLDVLVNNAGVGLGVPVDEMDMAEYDRLMDTNLKGMYMGCRYGVPLMKERGGGAIINISSVHGVNGGPGNTTYAATKGGIIGCTRGLAAELAPFRIRANTISPGAIDISEDRERFLKRVRQEDREEFRHRFSERMPVGHYYFQPLEMVGAPEDIAHCAVYLASKESRFVTGQNIVVDGGLTTYLSAFAPEEARQKKTAAAKEIEDWIAAHAATED